MKFIDTPEAFADASSHILGSPWAAVDTEADSLHHYTEKLCLLQVTVPGEDYVIDPLAPLPLAPFFVSLASMDLLFHAADGDIRLIKKAYPFSPKRMFDTMLAAQVLGYEKIGLQSLAERHCNIKLSKAEQKADWSERPLEEKLIRYAANDTHYLKTISELMSAEMEALGRLEWHRQQCVKLLETLEALPAESEEEDESIWQIRGVRNLKGPALTIFRELWYWRDGLAREKDRPSFKVLNSEYLFQIAEWAAAHPGRDIAEWEKAPRHVKRDHRDRLNALIKRAVSLPQATLELAQRKGPRKRWTERENRIMTELKVARDKIAKELAIQPSLIATNSVLEALSMEKPGELAGLQTAGMLPWQVGIAGEDLLKALTTP